MRRVYARMVARCSRSRYIGQLNTDSQLPASLHDVEPALGPGALRFARRCGCGTGSGRSSVSSNMEKMAELAPMPSASESTAMAVTTGFLKRTRRARRNDWSMVGARREIRSIRVGQLGVSGSSSHVRYRSHQGCAGLGSLIRPGPIQAKFVRPYTRRRRGKEIVEYAHPKLKPILARTQGIPIFQEQAMAIAMALAGYTGSEADELRRTMGNIRKEPRLIAALEKLRAAMVAQGIEPNLAVSICDDLKSFANYGFPESHAWSFALIAYATAYLKVHYPTDFYLGLLNAWPMGFYTPATLIHEAKRGGVEVRTPCLRDGDWECTWEGAGSGDRGSGNGEERRHPALRIGWRFVRGMGEKSLEKLRAAHEERAFSSIADVVTRARLTRAEVTLLALAGAFGAWEPNRHKAAWEGLRVCGDTLPLSPAHRVQHNPKPLTKSETIALDYFATSSSVHGHPMAEFREELRSRGVKDSRELEQMRDRAPITVAGLVVVRQRPSTANGTLFLLLEDEHGFINVIVPAKLVDPNELVVKQAQFILVRGRVEKEGASVSVLGEKFRRMRVGALEHASRDLH